MRTFFLLLRCIFHPMKKHLLNFTLLKNQALNANHNLLEFGCDQTLPPMQPGQFVEVRIDGSVHTYLRRPFSIHRVDPLRNTLHLLIKSVGEGTASLAGLKPGAAVNMLVPLGKGFPLEEGPEILLVGGGCGVAPLYFLADEMRRSGRQVAILIGGRTKNDILMADEYARFGKVLISTEDGSKGETGMVTAHSIFTEQVFPFKAIYCCGPDGMMKAVSHIAEKRGIPCYVSLENTMACGIGACLCCVVDTAQGHRCVCTDGPVFRSSELRGWTAETEVGCSIDHQPRQ